jgi:hypothetical protein
MSVDHYQDFPSSGHPEIEVVVRGTWYPGELRAWSQPFPRGIWWANVSYRTGAAGQYTGTVRSNQVRNAEPPAMVPRQR